MNSYFFYRRIRGPVFLLTFGATALLAEWDVLSFARSWPLYLIVFGVLRLAEGAAFAAAPPPVYPPTPQGYSGYGTPSGGQGFRAGSAPAAPAAPGTGLATVAPSTILQPGYTVVPEEEK